MGLYQRGLLDDCPPDHSTVCTNMKFNRKGETITRDGTKVSLTTSSAKVARIFIANFGHNNAGIVLTADGAGNIYRSDTGGVLLSLTNMVDFAACIMFGYCLISPILSTSGGGAVVYIWQANPLGGSDLIPIRKAAGVGPGTGMIGSENSIVGNIAVGIHEFAVSFITNTGYVTQPGPLGNPTPPTPENPTFVAVSVTSTGAKTVQLSNIPLGPSGTVARQILATQANLTLFYYAGGQIWNGSSLISWDGVIHDNTTTSIIISFFDTDLAVSADSLFDLLPAIPAGNYGLIAGIHEYNGRGTYFGGEFNLIRVSNPGAVESIDNVAGFIQLPDQFDGNDVTDFGNIQGVLYMFKPVGVFATIDNGNDPNTWQVTTIDIGVGVTSPLSVPDDPQNQFNLLIDFGGLYLFNGTAIQPPLTWKINDLWISIWQTTNLAGAMVQVDPYNKLIYVAQVGNALGVPGYSGILVGDYNDGLDYQNIKWSIYTFPFAVNSIIQAFFQDSGELAYRFRIGAGANINKIFPGLTTDVGSTAIASKWRTYYSYPPNGEGALNIFRFIRARALYSDNITLGLYSEDNAITATPSGFNTPQTTGRDLTREFNFTNEKCAVEFDCSASSGGFTLHRLDIFCKTRFNMRPSV